MAAAPIAFGDAGQNNRLTVGEFGHQRQVPAHGLDGLPERGKQQIAALFEARNTVLGDPKRLGYLYLSELACRA